MHVARIVMILCLILAIVFTNNPFARKEISQSWEEVRPDLVETMDSLYAAIRTFVTGGDSQDEIDEDSPEVDYERVITMNHVKFSGN